MSRYLLNGAYSKTCPDDLIERCAENGHPPWERIRPSAPAPALLKMASPQYQKRVQTALYEFRRNATWNEVKQHHGVVVTREAANLFIIESKKKRPRGVA